MEQVILVDKNDNQIGLEDKVKAHLGKGMLHRAFTILVFNDKEQVLIQQRGEKKMLWPLIWETTCSSHPLPGEDYIKAGERRLSQELGFTCQLELIDKFTYQSLDGDKGAEYEVCALLKGRYNGNIGIDSQEIADYKWIGLAELKKEIEESPADYAPWLKIALERYEKLL